MSIKNYNLKKKMNREQLKEYIKALVREELDIPKPTPYLVSDPAFDLKAKVDSFLDSKKNKTIPKNLNPLKPVKPE